MLGKQQTQATASSVRGKGAAHRRLEAVAIAALAGQQAPRSVTVFWLPPRHSEENGKVVVINNW